MTTHHIPNQAQIQNQSQQLPWYALWCIQAHGSQLYDIHPYRFHLESVAAVAVRFGFTDELTAIVCWLHDVLEDVAGQTLHTLLAAGFSQIAVDAAYALKDEDGANREERKAKTLPKIAANRLATVVKLCDRIANVEYGQKTAMYRHEHAAFKAALYRADDVELQPMWDHLDQLLAS
jgi:(p)ppGpp synthase/HD superfamily hydrolase